MLDSRSLLLLIVGLLTACASGRPPLLTAPLGDAGVIQPIESSRPEVSYARVPAATADPIGVNGATTAEGLDTGLTVGTEPLRIDTDETADQDPGAPDKDAQANNPLANLVALNLQNYYISELSESDEEANQFWIRYAQPVSTPIGDWLVRASLPLNKFPDGMDETESGLGDANVFATYLFDTGSPAVSFGIGPLVGLPTASDEVLGSDQYSAGAAVVYFNAKSKVIQYGGLVTYQHKIGGSGRRDDVNFLAVQPFGFVQLGEGYYLRAAPIWAFNLERGHYSVPVGFGLGKVVKLGKTVLNFFIEPQYSILDDGPGQPEFQIYSALNMQFYF